MKNKRLPFKKLCLTLCIIVFIILNGKIVAQETPWEWYSPQDSSFQIHLPKGNITLHTDTVSTAIGPLIYNKVMNKSEFDGKEFYTVISWSTYPHGSLHSDSTEILKDFWIATMEQSAENLGAEILYNESAEVGEWPAYKWKMSFDKNKRMDNLGIFVRNKFYLLQFSSPSSLKYTKMKERFFNSMNIYGN